MSFTKNVTSHVKSLPFIPLLYIALFLNIATILLVLFKRDLLPPEVPLFYGNPEGNEQIASWELLFLAPAISVSILILNTTLSIILKDVFLRHALSIASLVCSLFTTIAIFKIMFLVGSLF